MNRPFTINDSGADSNTTVLSIEHNSSNLQEKTMNKDVEKNDPSWDLRRVDSCE